MGENNKMDKMNEKENLLKRIIDKQVNSAILSKLLIWTIILIIISGETTVIIHYSIYDHDIEQTIEYDYFDKFCQYLIDTSSNVYGNLSKNRLKEEYEIWYTNKGYASIIIDENNNLTSAFYLEDTIDMLNYYLLTGETNF